MRVEEGEGGCPEGPVSRPVREQQLCGQRGGQREGTGGGVRAWPTTHAPTSLAVRALAFPHLRGPSSTAASIPRTPLCSGPVLCLAGGFPCSTGSVVHPILGAPAFLFDYVPFQTPGPTQPWFPPTYLAAPSAFPAHF